MEESLLSRAEQLATEFASSTTTIEELNGLMRLMLKSGLERMLAEVGRNLRNQCWRDLHAVQLLDDLLDVAGDHPLGVQSENLLVEIRDAALVLADNLWLERAVTITGRAESHLTQIALHGLPRTGLVISAME